MGFGRGILAGGDGVRSVVVVHSVRPGTGTGRLVEISAADGTRQLVGPEEFGEMVKAAWVELGLAPAPELVLLVRWAIRPSGSPSRLRRRSVFRRSRSMWSVI